MAKRQSWDQEEDKVISSLISFYEAKNKKIKWSQISILLKQQHPESNRTGKQCRQRWLNHLRPSLIKNEDLDHIDLQQLFRLIRVYGKKWSIIAKELQGRTDNTIKNFFYASLRKGLRNLNLYNTQLRYQRRYKCYKQDLIQKLLSVHDQKKNKDLYISDLSVYDLAENIRQTFISCSRHDMKSYQGVPAELEQYYESLNQKVTQFCRICKFKKTREKKNDEEKFQVFTRKINKKSIKLEHIEESMEKATQVAQKKQIKIQEQIRFYQMKEIPTNQIKTDIDQFQQQIQTYLNSSQFNPLMKVPEGQNGLELSLFIEGTKQKQDQNLFERLSMSIQQNNFQMFFLY